MELLAAKHFVSVARDQPWLDFIFRDFPFITLGPFGCKEFEHHWTALSAYRPRRAIFWSVLCDSEMALRLPSRETGIQVAVRERSIMPKLRDQKGKIGYIILWLLGVPASVLILIFLLRGCT